MRLWALVLIGCGRAPLEDTAGPIGNFPSAVSASTLAAYVAAETYRGSGWTPSTDAPRDRTSTSSPHGWVRVWLNDEVLASAKAGNGEFHGSAHHTGSMAVKEMYDGDEVIGVAVMLKLAGDAAEWAYWCDGPESRCGIAPPTDPFYGLAADAECAFCHGGLVFDVL